jgi:23S rRNA (pseudouridine1915-N3)-methyltransferase
MRILLLSVGRVRGPGLAAAISGYENRLRHYYRFESIQVSAASLPDERAAESRGVEAAALLGRLPRDSTVIALTRTGEMWSTRQLADRIARAQTYSEPGIAFVVGGAHGLDRSMLDRAAVRLSLSEMTLPHEIARLFLTEQLYRAGTILRGEPYHKGP